MKSTPREVRIPDRTVTYTVTAPAGTATTKDPAAAVRTCPVSVILSGPSKETRLSAGFRLKPSPLIVTAVPGSPDAGEIPVTLNRSLLGNGTANVEKWVTSIEAVLPLSSTMAVNSLGT